MASGLVVSLQLPPYRERSKAQTLGANQGVSDKQALASGVTAGGNASRTVKDPCKWL